MLAIIPARSGSKGLPGKNIKSFNGKPLIQYTIEAACNSKYIDNVIVSTDDKEIARISKNAGAQIPFLRPAELAGDDSSAVDVYLHAVDFMMKKTKTKIDKFIVLLGTAPLRTSEHIDEACQLFFQKKADTLVSMKEAETPLSWYYCKNEEGYVCNADLANSNINMMANRQKNSTYYVPNGAIYILDYSILKEQRTYYTENTVAYIMESKHSIDIDNQLDFEIAEYIARIKNN